MYSESFIKNGHISNISNRGLQHFEKIIKSDGKIAPNHLLGKVCPDQRNTETLYSPPYEGELLEFAPLLCSEDMLGKWLGVCRGWRGECTGGGRSGWPPRPPPLAMKLRACSASY